MGIESQAPAQPAVNLTPRQVKTFQKVEPKALGSIQIVIAVLCLCLSVSVLQIYYEVHFTPDLIVVVVIVVQILASGSILIHAGRFPSLFWVKATLAIHLVSAAFTTAALGLLSRHLPYRQDSYHCEHCRRLEIYAVLPGVVQRIERPPARPAPPQPEIAPPQVEVVEEVMVPEAAREPFPQPVEEASTPPTEPQVEPIDSIAEV
ncbi:uncharacterized protein si:dkey-81h8.1 isoform X3 [Pangasianodon hypophthalmus]|uniref:uncharacterized protein si:dkey-81h8.1 isoform X3 n=1 Tax=Pangasianodon hypophthalmus TaxID=310915 RepID=UPI000EFDBD8E|nr:uncharacterized protein si:dkey-81h8.1 isoform X3 [Pangasianodon hypophthalmus]